MTPTQGEHAQTEALRLAEILEGDYCPDWFYEQGVDEVSAELRRLHAQVAALTAAPAQPAAPQGVAEVNWWEADGDKYDASISPMQPAQGVAYAELPKLFREALAWGMTYGPEIPAHQWEEMRESMVKQYTDRASNGQAPAGASKFADVIAVQRSEAESDPSDAYMVGLYNGMSMMDANYRNITDWEPMGTVPKPTPTAQAAPAAERQYINGVKTVADLVNNLLLLDQSLPIYAAQHIQIANRRRTITVPPTVSRERVKDERWIGEGDEMNAAVIWTRAAAPATQQPEGDVVAYLDVGASGYLDLGAALSEDAVRQLPKGRHALVIAGTWGINGYVAAPQPSPTPQADNVPAVDTLDAAFEAVRKRLCGVQRYSFVLDDDGLVRRVQDRAGNWIEFDEAHALFDPVAVDAARKQGGKHDNH